MYRAGEGGFETKHKDGPVEVANSDVFSYYFYFFRT